MNHKLVYSPEEARLLLNLGRSAIYEALRTRAIPSIRVGKKYLIPVEGLRRWLLEQPSEPQADENKK